MWHHVRQKGGTRQDAYLTPDEWQRLKGNFGHSWEYLGQVEQKPGTLAPLADVPTQVVDALAARKKPKDTVNQKVDPEPPAPMGVAGDEPAQ